MTTDRFAPGVQAALALAITFTGCAQTAPGRMPAPPPPQVHVIPLNEQLEGDWSAAYPGGPLHVSIQDDPQLGDHNYVARLVNGSYGTIHPGAITFTGTPNYSVPNLVGGYQKCSVPGRIGLLRAPMSITVQDADHFTENLVRKDACPGFPIKFTRTANRWAPPRDS
ncbi:MAG: hypothetical protein ACLQAT_11565 [Candidatus Binataceae bacterium]